MPKTKEDLLPEEILIATFSQLDANIRLSDDEHLAKIFNDAAEEPESIFRPFSWHQQYRFSEQLAECLQNLDSAGSITRENASQTLFRVSRRTTGPYGKSMFESLDQPSQQKVKEVVQKLQETFGEP